tara:strand:- start:7973 stop:9442 length:1470 start_codon:yes stop_codon:yes gene_type:complete
MKKFFLFLALLSPSLFSSTIIGNPNVEINSEGLYLIQIKISSTKNISEDDIFLANFKSDEELTDFNFEFKIFENLQDFKRLTLAIPRNYSEDYVSFRLDIKKELKKDIFIFLPQNNSIPKQKAQVSFKIPAKRNFEESQKYDLKDISSENEDNEDIEFSRPNVFSLAKPIVDKNKSIQDFDDTPISEINDINESIQDLDDTPSSEISDINKSIQDSETISSTEVETIWSVSESVSQQYDASIYQIMWGFYLENPNAFIDDNIHLVRADIDLAMPSQDLVASTSDTIVKESVAFMETKKNQLQRYAMKPIFKLTAPEEIFSDSVIKNDSNASLASELKTDPILEIDNSEFDASEIVSKNTSIIELKSETDLSIQPNTKSDSKVFELRDVILAGVLSLLLGFAIAYMLIRSTKRPSFTRAALEEDLKEEDNTFQTNLSITNDIETQELDLVRTYIEMDDWDSAVKILNKLISNSKNNLIISEAQLLLKEKK